MSLELEPLTDALRGVQSCVFDMRWNVDGLLIAVETFPNAGAPCLNYDVRFGTDRGFVVLDDSDLPSWFSPSAVRSGHIVYRVSAGGWLDHGPSEAFAIARGQCTEWLVVTGNECVSVFSAEAPTVHAHSA